MSLPFVEQVAKGNQLIYDNSPKVKGEKITVVEGMCAGLCAQEGRRSGTGRRGTAVRGTVRAATLVSRRDLTYCLGRKVRVYFKVR